MTLEVWHNIVNTGSSFQNVQSKQARKNATKSMDTQICNRHAKLLPREGYTQIALCDMSRE